MEQPVQTRLGATVDSPEPPLASGSTDGANGRSRLSSFLSARPTGRFVASWFWASLASGFTQLLPFAVVALISRILTFEEFARVSLAQMAIVNFLGVANAGLGIMATRYVSRYATSNPERLGRVLGLTSQVAFASAVLCGGCLLLLGGVMARTLYEAPELEIVLRASSIPIFFLVLNGYQVGALLGLGEFRQMAFINGVQALLSVALVAVAAIAWADTGAVLAIGVGAFAMWLHYTFLIRRALRLLGVAMQWRGAWQEVSALVNFALPAAASSIVANVALFAANVFLVRSPDGVGQAALFAVCFLVRSAVVFLPMMAQRVYGIRLTAQFGVMERRPFEILYAKTILLNAAYGFLAVLFVLPFGETILTLAGSKFVSASSLLSIVLVATFLEIVGTSLYLIIPASGRMWVQGGVNAMWATIVVTGTALFASSKGAMALAWSHAAAWAVSIVFYFVASRYLLRSVYRSSEVAPR